MSTSCPGRSFPYSQQSSVSFLMQLSSLQSFPVLNLNSKFNYTKEKNPDCCLTFSLAQKNMEDSDSNRFKAYCLPPVCIQGSPHVVVFLRKIVSTSFIFFYLAPLPWLFSLPSFQVHLQSRDKV